MTTMDERAGARLNLSSALCVLSAVLLLGAAAGPLYAHLIGAVQAWQWTAVFAGAAGVGLAAALIHAVVENHWSFAPERSLNHVSGWGFVGVTIIVALIIYVAQWAASGGEVGRAIQAELGRAVVALVAALFIAAVMASWEPAANAVGAFARYGDWIIDWLGRLLSALDGFLVFGVAGSAGASLSNPTLRFGMLFAVLAACGLMGYWLEPPWGFVPIVWGFLVAVSMSRRWAWVEDDRELAMMSGRYHGDHLRIGFKQNYRAEALWAFTALFLFVPLALRQAQLAADHYGFVLFHIEDVAHGDLTAWIGFYGTELAKAVPFVDWAEVYHVQGDAPIEAREPIAQHAVFLTRVVVDLLLLATLLQALSVTARNRRQHELFYDKKQIFKLDPFTETIAFKRLRRFDQSGWLADTSAIKAFPPDYDAVRLAELSDKQRYPEVYMVATEMRALATGGKGSEQFFEELRRRVRSRKKDAVAIDGIVSAIKTANILPDVGELDDARRRLNNLRPLNKTREHIINLIVEAPDSDARFIALSASLRGADIDSIRDVREAALLGLKSDAERGVVSVIEAIRYVEKEDRSPNLRQTAREILEGLGRRSTS